MTNEEKFVVFPAGTSLYAVPAASVAELILPQPVFSFPHTSHEILGVILRRGRVIPLYDLAGLLKLPESAPAQYHLIALCRTAETTGLAAFPVSGECDLISADVLAMKHPASGVVGELTWDGRSYELLNLEELILSQNAQLQPVPETPAAGSTV